MTQPSNDGIGWVRFCSVLVPGEIREHWWSDLKLEQQELRDGDASRPRRHAAAFKELLCGIAQHVPLRAPPPAGTPRAPLPRRRAARGGWIAWRLAGPLLFAGVLTGSGALLGLGGAALVGAFGCLATLRGKLDREQTRLFNGVLAGSVALVALVLAFICVTAMFVAISAMFSSNVLAALAVRALVVFATGTLAVLGGTGWVPDVWHPRRLVDVRNAAPRPAESLVR